MTALGTPGVRAGALCFSLSFALTAALAQTSVGNAPAVASPGTSSSSRMEIDVHDAQVYRNEVQACLSRGTQARETCLQQARDTLAEKRRATPVQAGKDVAPESGMAGCQPLTGEYKAACPVQAAGSDRVVLVPSSSTGQVR
jgi:hypothetical protein